MIFLKYGMLFLAGFILYNPQLPFKKRILSLLAGILIIIAMNMKK